MNVSFEIYVANYYRNKVKNARKAGHVFTLSLQSVHNMLSAQRCYYTGVRLTRPPTSAQGELKQGYKIRPTDVTIDRVDSAKGYVKGNVVACSHAANSAKGMFENPSCPLDVKDMINMANKLQSRKGW